MNQEVKTHSAVETGDIILLPIIYRENFELDIGFYYQNTVKNLHYCYVFETKVVNGQTVSTVIALNSTRSSTNDRRRAMAAARQQTNERPESQPISRKFGELEDGYYYIEADRLPEQLSPIVHDTHLNLAWRIKIVHYPGLSFFIYRKQYQPELFADLQATIQKYVPHYDFGTIQLPMMSALYELHLSTALKNRRRRR